MKIHQYEVKPGHLARRFQQIAVAAFQAEMETIGIDITPVQYAALAAIKVHPGVDQITLAGKIAFDRTTITGVLDRLESKGLVLRTVSESDRRARELTLTAEGSALLARMDPAVDAAQKAMVRGLSDDEGAQLLRLLRKAVDAANDLSRAPKR